MHTASVKRKILNVTAALLLFRCLGWGAPGDNPKDLGKSEVAAIINKYVEASASHADVLRGASMQVDINATVPKLKEHGRLRALRKISKVGQITYHVLGFQGDNTVKSQVIARYLQAEQQGQANGNLAVGPTNYKFKYKGEWPFEGKQAYLFQLSPREKRVGLFKGEIWLDADSYLPVFEKGRFVKNPSIFFKRVIFERGFVIENGVAIPQYVLSTIDTRVIGKVELDISYSNFEENAGPDTDESGSTLTLHARN